MDPHGVTMMLTLFLCALVSLRPRGLRRAAPCGVRRTASRTRRKQLWLPLNDASGERDESDAALIMISTALHDAGKDGCCSSGSPLVLRRRANSPPRCSLRIVFPSIATRCCTSRARRSTRSDRPWRNDGRRTTGGARLFCIGRCCCSRRMPPARGPIAIRSTCRTVSRLSCRGIRCGRSASVASTTHRAAQVRHVFHLVSADTR